MNLSLKFKLGIILLIAACLRLYGLNWDQGHHLQPDERMIIMVAERLSLPRLLNLKTLLDPNSSLNPKFFAYGSLPLYFLKVVSVAISQIFDQQWAHYSHLQLVGRSLSVLFDLGTIFLIFKIGEKVFSVSTALLGSLFYALAVLPIQLSHFYAVDVALNFFIFLTLYRLILFYEKQTFKQAVLVGISFGLALATKISATTLVVSIGIAFLFDYCLIFLKKWCAITSPWWQKLFFVIFKSKKREVLVQIIKPLSYLGLTTFTFTIFTFILFEPYALIDSSFFWRQIKEQHQMTKNAFVFPYTLQYVDSTPYFYHLKNLWLWGLGISLGSLSLISVGWYLFSLYQRIKTKGEEDIEAKEIILLVFFVAYFLTVGRFAVKFMRYLLPLYPLFCLFSARLIVSLPKKLKKIVAGFALLGAFTWTLSFVSIYSQPNTRVLATRWFQKNVPQGAKIAVEHWDDRVPLRGNYQFLTMPMYEPDSSPLKWQQVETNLQQADYLVLASNRLYVPLPKLADCQKYPQHCYPKTAQYYQELFNEQLGFKKVAEFTAYPTIPLLNYSIKDDRADESFTVYDHPKVIVFEKIND